MHLDKKDAVWIKGAFEKVAYEGLSIYKTIKWLKEQDARSCTGKPLEYSMVHAMLHNPFYYGEFEFPRKSGKMYKGIHKPAITKKLFNDTQEKIAQVERKKRYRKSKTAPFGFLQMIRCGTCTSSITAEEKYKTLKSGEEAVYRYYVCARNRNRDCREKYINEETLMSELGKVLDKMEVNKIGMKEMLSNEIDRFYRIQAFIDNEEVQDRSAEKKDYDLRKYAKTIFESGTIEEQRSILRNMKGKLILKDKKIYIDKLPESVNETVTEVGE